MKTFQLIQTKSLDLTGIYKVTIYLHLIAYVLVSGADAVMETRDSQRKTALTDVSRIPDILVPEPGDHVVQSELLKHIVGTTLADPARIDEFNNRKVYSVKLSTLKKHYEKKDENIIKGLSQRQKIDIDSKFVLETGTGQISMATSSTMLDFQLTVANEIGFSTILPNRANAHTFLFTMDLKKPTREFHGKHSMIGFNTKGCVLYIGQAMNLDVYLAMAPDDFLSGLTPARPAGYTTGSSIMSTRHYRQIVVMIAHFLAKVSDRAYYTLGDVEDIDLEATSQNWGLFSNIM